MANRVATASWVRWAIGIAVIVLVAGAVIVIVAIRSFDSLAEFAAFDECSQIAKREQVSPSTYEYTNYRVDTKPIGAGENVIVVYVDYSGLNAFGVRIPNSKICRFVERGGAIDLVGVDGRSFKGDVDVPN